MQGTKENLKCFKTKKDQLTTQVDAVHLGGADQILRCSAWPKT